MTENTNPQRFPIDLDNKLTRRITDIRASNASLSTAATHQFTPNSGNNFSSPITEGNRTEKYIVQPYDDVCATCPKCEVITGEILKKIWKTADIERLNKVALLLNYYINIGQIDNEYRLSHFCSQSVVETGEDMKLVENISYTNAQKKYQTNKWLENKFEGDGYRFIGRGLMHLTGRYNYTKFQNDYVKLYNEEPYNYLNSPNYVHLTITDSVRSGLWFWTNSSNKPVRFAVDNSLSSIKAVTKSVQGSLNYLTPRQNAFEKNIWKNRIFKNICFNKTLQNSNYLALRPVSKNIDNPPPFKRDQELGNTKN